MSTVVVAVSVSCDIHTQQLIIPIATTEPDVPVYWVMLYTTIGKKPSSEMETIPNLYSDMTSYTVTISSDSGV